MALAREWHVFLLVDLAISAMDLSILLLLIAEFRVPLQIPKKIARAKAMGNR